MKILITGGAGFIGQRLARKLVSDGHRVTALDLLIDQVHQDAERDRESFPGVVVQRDVADAASWRGMERHDAIIHLAAETGTAQSMYEKDRYTRVNLDGTRHAVEAALSWDAPIISLSSRAVYGEGLPVGEGSDSHALSNDYGPRGDLKPSHEDDPHRPLSVYGETKSLGEAEVKATEGRVPAVIVRPQNVIGHGQALHNPYTGVLAAFLARLKETRNLIVYGDGTQTRDFIHVQDLADFIVWNLDNPPAPEQGPRVLNAGSGVRTSLLQLAEYSIRAAPVSGVGIEHLDVRRGGDIDHACADLGRGQLLGAPAPRWTAEDAVADFILKSWAQDGAGSAAWDGALIELDRRGLVD